MAGQRRVKSFIYNDLPCCVTAGNQALVSLPSIEPKMYPIHIGSFAFKERI